MTPRQSRPRTLFGDVVHQQRADGAPVVGAGDGAVPLLPRRVPDLRLDGLPINLRPQRRCSATVVGCCKPWTPECIPQTAATGLMVVWQH